MKVPRLELKAETLSLEGTFTIRDPRTAWRTDRDSWTDSEDRSVRLGPRFFKFFWSWSGSVRDFLNFASPGPVRSEIF